MISELAASPQVLPYYFLLLCYLAWRLWRFHIVPMIWSNEPRYLPYWIPYLGHTIGYLKHVEKLYTQGYNYFQGLPFALNVGGQAIVVIRDVQDVSELWRNTSSLSFDPFVQGVFRAFGFPGSFIETVFTDDPERLVRDEYRSISLLVNDNPSRKCYVHLQADWFKIQLLSREMLAEIQQKFYDNISEDLLWENVQKEYTLSKTKSQAGTGLISLAKFCRSTVSLASMKTFLGERILKDAPNFRRDYQLYEDQSWKIFFQIPPMFARDLHAAKEHVIEALSNYTRLPSSERPGLGWIFRTMNTELQALGIAERDRCGLMMMVLWGINNNAHHMCFWILAHLLEDPSMFAPVRSEIDSAFDEDGAFDIEKLLSSSPYLDAMWHEALRLYNAASGVRKAEEDTILGGKLIRKGTTISAPFRQFHMNQSIFGEDAPCYSPQRFLKNKSMHRTKGYTPFGGGRTYCPGRLFAQAEVYTFLSLVLRRFDLTIIDGGRVPNIDTTRPYPAAMGPANDILVSVQKRKQNVA